MSIVIPGKRTTFFMSRFEAEKMTRELETLYVGLGPRAALISMISPKRLFDSFGHVWTEPAVDGAWADVLKLKFDDKDPGHMSKAEAEQWIMFDDAMADQIIDFVDRNADRCNVFPVHCEAGISRSAAVAKFISVRFNLSFPESYMLYNKHVFSTLIRRWNQRNFSGS